MLRLVLIAVLCRSNLALPIIDDPSSPEYGNYIEGDMIEPFKGAFSGLLSSANRWPSATVVYKIDSALSSTLKSRSLEAMQRITSETKSCIKFRQATSKDTGYVLIRGRDSGCSATVGYWKRETYVNLGSSCSAGTIMHELQHTLGVHHQQSRPDRDNFVSIVYENIKEGHEHNFKKYTTTQVSTYGVAYDYNSQMHYSEYAFSKNGKRTIVAKPGKLPPGGSIGRRDRMSSGDVAIIKAMYKC